jgi:hypothetical protein
MRKLTAHAQHELTFASKTLHEVSSKIRVVRASANNQVSFYSTLSFAQEEIFWEIDGKSQSRCVWQRRRSRLLPGSLGRSWLEV